MPDMEQQKQTKETHTKKQKKEKHITKQKRVLNNPHTKKTEGRTPEHTQLTFLALVEVALVVPRFDLAEVGVRVGANQTTVCLALNVVVDDVAHLLPHGAIFELAGLDMFVCVWGSGIWVVGHRRTWYVKK